MSKLSQNIDFPMRDFLSCEVCGRQVTGAENMLLNKKIASDQFNNMVNRLNSDLMNVNNEIEVLSERPDTLKDYVEEGLELLANLDRLFNESDYEGKRILAGSLFTQKLVFGNSVVEPQR